jgi:O-succinylbenzoic acid--CoA ligase
MKFLNWLSQIVISHPEAIALSFKLNPSEQSLINWSYAQLESLAQHWAWQLEKLGLKTGDRLGILLNNHPRYLILIHALAKCGVIGVFLNTRLTDLEIAWQLRDSGPDYLVYDIATKLTAIAVSKQIESLNIIDLSHWSITSLATESINLQTNSQNNWLDFEQIQGIFYTSGTTGKPKAVPLTYGNHYHSAIASTMGIGSYVDDNWLLCMPMFHVGGLVIAWRSVINGTKITLMPKFDEQLVLDAIAGEQVTLISLVPTMLIRLLKHPQWQNLQKSQKLRGILLGGASANEQLISRCLELKLPLMPTYGMTETASQITTLLPHEVISKRGSSGLPLWGIQIKIVDRQNIEQELETGAIGQILVRGANVMGGYLHNSANHEWLPTGDLGYLDSDRYLYVVNRRHDLIISGGENIYPREIEAILEQHPAITEVCVIGIADQEWGEIVAAAIVLKPSPNIATSDQYQISLTTIRSFCEEKGLSRYKLPKAIYFVDDLPKSASGKILRQALIQGFAYSTEPVPSSNSDRPCISLNQ